MSEISRILVFNTRWSLKWILFGNVLKSAAIGYGRLQSDLTGAGTDQTETDPYSNHLHSK